MDNYMKDIVNNKETVEKIIEAINSGIQSYKNKQYMDIAKKLNVNPFSLIGSFDLYNYFLKGQCNVYSKILCDIFKEYSTPYDNGEHIITKIGEFYYDVSGLYMGGDINKFMVYEKPYLLSNAFSLGGYDKIDDLPMIDAGVAAGQKYISDYLINEDKKESRK